MCIYNKNNLPTGYYVYVYLRKKDLSPYYVGKGKGMRAYDKKHRVHPPEDRSRIVFVVRNVSESAAHAEEKHLIAIFGRIDNGTGCLANLTDGGEGPNGYKFTPEVIAKIVAKTTGQKRAR